jgi:2-oxo-3-hexenedioate decarboxylase
MAVSGQTLAQITNEVFSVMGAPREVATYTSRFPGFDLEDAYRVVEGLRSRREARGERVVGTKIGFTNSAAWAGYGISGPMWNYLYDTSTDDLRSVSEWPLRGSPNIRMEVEIALGLCAAPEPGMDDHELLNCVDWVALDFEICSSIFPEWRFAVADAATTGVHLALLLGERRSIGDSRARWAADLASFSATLSEVGGAHASGGGGQVLGSPIKAFGFLVRELARFGGRPLRKGDIVTTGTLTQALPAMAGQLWQAHVDNIPLADVEIRLV